MASLETIRDVLLALSGGIAVWIVASLPGYWLLGVFGVMHRAVSGAVGLWTERIREQHHRRAATAEATRTRLALNLRLLEVDETVLNAWRNTLAASLREAKEVSSELSHTRTVAKRALKSLESLGRRIRRLPLTASTLPSIPNVEEMLLRATRNRVSSLNLVVALVLLVPIWAANAFLTGLVLADFLPPIQPFLGIAPSYAVAMIIVIAETAMGVLHSVSSQRDETLGRSLTLPTMLCAAFGLLVVALESLLYAQIESTGTMAFLPFGGSVFWLVGAMLGAAVFGLGLVAHSSLATMRKDRTPATMAKQLARLREAADEWNVTAERSEPTRNATAESLDRLASLARKTAELEATGIQSFQIQLEHARNHPPAWATPSARALSEAEFIERESKAFLWSAAWLIAGTSLAVIATVLSSRTNDLVGLALGVGIAVVGYAAGAIAASNAQGTLVRRLLVYGGLLAVLTLGVVLASQVLRSQWSYHAVALLIPALAAFAAGAQTGATVALLRLPLLWLGHRVLNLLGGLSIVVLLLARVVAAVLEFVARLIAWPLTAMLGSLRKQRSEPVHGV